MKADALISGSRAAEMLSVSRVTVARWVRSGRLRGFVQGRVTRVWASSVAALFDAGVGAAFEGADLKKLARRRRTSTSAR